MATTSQVGDTGQRRRVYYVVLDREITASLPVVS